MLEMRRKDYQAISHAKRLQRSEAIPKEWSINPKKLEGINLLDVPLVCGLLSNIELEVTSQHDATSLLEGLRAGTWSVEQVTIAFCKRAAVAQQLVNCLTEVFFDEAIERAGQLDRQRLACVNTEVLPPLFGLPVSLKDTFAVKGHDTSTGLACYVNEPAGDHSAIAAMLLDLGAILYCKTNVPQSVMTGDSDNHVFGRTLNPQNVSFTAGGSTGDGVRSTVGPLATTLRDCALFLRTVMQAGTWRYDSNVVSLPWKNVKRKERLRIGLVEDDGVYTPVPPVRRGLKKAGDLLRMSEQVEIVPLTLPNVQDHYEDLLSYFTLSGSEHYLEHFSRTGEPLVPSLAAIGLLSKPASTLESFFALNVRRAEATRTYLRLFLENQLDAILMPAAPHTALPWDTWTSATYTGLWSYLDYPAVVIPVDVVAASDLMDDPARAKYGPNDTELYKLYTGPERYEGLPIAVQIIGYRHQDEELIATAEMLDSIINGEP
ncbi:fatty-acid amide hydrolase, putative [Trichoderma parareesei]|uniref:Fatty-acid amide hydrolase, putative n=1 Tax=Trichoderma parareesei TaxID=858221 RepID=A0A2H2YTD2_TRIPA|nr:fatty-acid amide hydrolase, putative [Trichoderma parareesei]